MLYDDMKVETPVHLPDIVGREIYPGHPDESQCSNCLKAGNEHWYPLADIWVVRHWTIASVDDTGGGKWMWYCPDHLTNRSGNWWRSSHLAPANLLPQVTHDCEYVSGLTTVCGELAVEPFDGTWMCERHAESARIARRQAEILSREFEGE